MKNFLTLIFFTYEGKFPDGMIKQDEREDRKCRKIKEKVSFIRS